MWSTNEPISIQESERELVIKVTGKNEREVVKGLLGNSNRLFAHCYTHNIDFPHQCGLVNVATHIEEYCKVIFPAAS